MQHPNALNRSQPLPLIDVLSEGFAVVNRCLWVIVIPILVDLYFWLGPRIGITPLLRQLGALNPQARDQIVATLNDEARTQLASLNVYVDALRRLQMNPLQPLVPALRDPAAPWPAAAWQLDTWGSLFGLLLLFNSAAIVMAACYLLPLARVIKGHTPIRVRAVVHAIGSFFGVVVLVLGAIGSLSLMVVLMATIIAFVAQPLAVFFLFVWMSVVVWFMFVTSFSFDAIVLEGMGPLRAIWRSFRTVQRSLWSALGLWLLTALIVWGFVVIWQALSATGVGLLVAIVGSAYITTGMAAAHLVFFRNRAALNAPRPAPQRSG